MEAVDISDIQARIEQQREARLAVEAERIKQVYSYIRPFDQAASSYVRQVQDDDRFYLGVPEIDSLTRGHSRGDLTFVTGRPFSGKTQLVLNAINYNADSHGIIFTPDESAEAILAKLVGIRYGINAELLEERIKAGDQETLRLLHHVAAVDFSRLIVIDAGLSILEMGRALDEAEQHWGHSARYAVYDYLELLPGDSGFSGTMQKAQAIKRWTTEANLAMQCLHQGKRGEGNRGESVGMEGMRNGGEDVATVVLEVFRKRDSKKLSDFDRQGHKNTVTVNVAKNKRPPMLTGEVDLYMDPATGLIRALSRTDLVRDGLPTTNAAEMLGLREDVA